MESLDETRALFSTSIRVLVVEDSPEDSQAIQRMLDLSDGADFEVANAVHVEDALGRLHGESFDVVLLDLTLPEGRGLSVLSRARVAAASVPIVVMTREDDLKLALQALHEGAQDYLVKDKFDAHLLERTLIHSVERHRMLMQLRLAQKREHFLATHDSLTGLPNRSSLLEHLRRSIRESKGEGGGTALLVLDLDGFKKINDTLGHPAGDELLRVVGRRLSDVSLHNEFVARLAGDEFVLVAPVPRREAAREVGDRIVEALSRPYSLSGRECHLSCSVGVSVHPFDGDDVETLIRRSDTAMFQAKRQRSNQVRVFSDDMEEVTTRRVHLGEKLRKVLESDELTIHYQPVCEISSSEIVRVEALLRWHDSDAGEIRPAEFIAIAEDTGMIVPIGYWVLRTACTQLQRWWLAGVRTVPVAVNVSDAQLMQPDFVDNVERLLAELAMEPSKLEMEITEATMMRESAATRRGLEGLSRLGVGITLDDFGTSYSSLSDLRRFSVGRVKIERAFVSEVSTSGSGAALTSAIIALAHSLGLTVVAEGVETPEQRAFLAERGCDEFQGFLLSPAVPADEVVRFLGRDQD